MALLSRLRLALLPALLSAAVVLVLSCSIAEDYEALNFWFDGVPTPEEAEAARAAALAEEAEVFDPTSVEAKAARAARNASRAPKVSTHVPVVEKKCTECHKMSAARSESSSRWSTDLPELLAEKRVLCLRCHDSPTGVSSHGPAASGDCSVCHYAHSSPNPNLLRNASQIELCTACHQSETFATSARHELEWAGRECTECHDPHASSRHSLLREGIEEDQR